MYSHLEPPKRARGPSYLNRGKSKIIMKIGWKILFTPNRTRLNYYDGDV